MFDQYFKSIISQERKQIITKWFSNFRTLTDSSCSLVVTSLCAFLAEPSCVTWDDDTGVFVPPLHGFVSGVGDGEEVWWPLVQLAALVLLHGVPAVDVHGAVGVDGHHHLPDVAVDPGLLKPEDAGRFSVKDCGQSWSRCACDRKNCIKSIFI